MRYIHIIYKVLYKESVFIHQPGLMQTFLENFVWSFGKFFNHKRRSSNHPTKGGLTKNDGLNSGLQGVYLCGYVIYLRHSPKIFPKYEFVKSFWSQLSPEVFKKLPKPVAAAYLSWKLFFASVTAFSLKAWRYWHWWPKTGKLMEFV